MKKVLLITTSVVMVLVVVVALLVSPIAKHYVEKNSKELCGRNVSLGDVSINIFTGKVEIQNLNIYEAKDTTSFCFLGAFKTKLSYSKLFSGLLYVDYLVLDGLKVQILQNGDKYNFDDIVEFFSNDDTKKTVQPSSDTISITLAPVVEKNAPWGVVINDIRINNSNIVYQDLQINSRFDLEEFSLYIPGIDLSDMSNEVGIKLNFLRGGALYVSNEMDSSGDVFHLNVGLKDFHMSGLTPYIQQIMKVDDVEGSVNLNLFIDGALSNIFSSKLSGSLNVSDFSLMDNNKVSVLSLDSLNVTLKEMRFDTIAPIKIGNISLVGVSSSFSLYADSSDTFTNLLVSNVEQEPDTVTRVENTEDFLKLDIDSLRARNCDFVYIDETLPEAFKYELSEINMNADNVSTYAHSNSFNVNALMQKHGKLHIVWSGDWRDVANHNLTIILSNIKLADFSPYSLSFFGNPISDGAMAFESQNKVTSYNLVGTNNLKISNPTIGNRRNGVKPQYKVPLKLGLYMLTDKDNNVDIDLPVSGRVDDPQFSLRKIIFKSFCNLLIKVAASPFSFLGSNSDGDGNFLAMSDVQYDFTIEQYKNLDMLAARLREKPQMVVTLTSRVNWPEALLQMAEFRLLQDYYISRNPGKNVENFELLDYKACKEININSSDVSRFAAAKLAQNGIVAEGNSIRDKAVALYGETTGASVVKMAQHRDASLKRYFVDNQSIPESQVLVNSMPADSIPLSKDRSGYIIEVNMEGE